MMEGLGEDEVVDKKAIRQAKIIQFYFHDGRVRRAVPLRRFDNWPGCEV